jgi:hypothetical protein
VRSLASRVPAELVMVTVSLPRFSSKLLTITNLTMRT